MNHRDQIEPVAVDLLWVRPGKVGGTEPFIRNLLDGFSKVESDFKLSLLVSRDNASTFEHYTEDERFTLLKAPTESSNISKRILWQNAFQNRFLRKNGIKRCFEPVYCKPWFNGKVEYICVIHDLQALHYPEYHPLHEVLYSLLCWKMDVINAKKIIAISNFVKADIENWYKRNGIKVIYNPVTVDTDNVYPFDRIKEKYALGNGGFLYTVSQAIPHKNLISLIEMMKYIDDSTSAALEGIKLKKLLITGISGSASD